MTDSYLFFRILGGRLLGCARLSLLTAGALLLAACGGGGGGGGGPPPPSPLTLHAAASVDSNTTTLQTAAGGTPPYTYSIAAGGGSIDASGDFTSPTGPMTVTIAVADSKGASAQSSIAVNAPLLANQPTVSIGGDTSLLVGGAGGQGPFTYKVTSGGGTVDASGRFTAPSTAGTSVVSITDSLGSSTSVTITIDPPLSISPASATLTASSAQTTPFLGTNGVPPYQYAVVSGSGTVNAQGIYTVGTLSGTSTVQVTDSQGTTANAQVRALRIRVNTAVFATATDGTNLYVGGRFSATNPYSAPRLAIVDQTTGNLATTCDLGTGFLSGTVTAIATVGNVIYVAGNFSQYRGVAVGKLAKIDATTCAIDPIFIGGGGFGSDPGSTVGAIAISGASLYAVGNVDTYRGAANRGIVKLDLTTGAADPKFSSGILDASIATVVVSGASVYVGGYFTQMGGVPSPYLVKLDAATGAIDTAFAAAPGADGPVTSLAIAANQLYIGGSFAHFAGIQTALARVNATSGALDTAFTQSVANASQVTSLLLSGNSVYVARAGIPVLAKIDAITGTTDAAFITGAGFDLDVYSLLMANSSLYVGGGFTSYRGAPAYNLAKIDPTSGVLDTTFTRATGGNNSVFALAASGSQVIAGGGLTAYRGAPASNIAKFSLATDEPDLAFSAAAGTNSTVIRMALNGTSLYLGGVFTSCGSTNSFNIAKVDAATGACDATFAAGGGAPFFVDAMLIHGSSLYIGGGNSSATHLAKMDLLTGQTDPAFSVNGGPDATVMALTDSPTAIYVGGQFQNYGALPARNLAKVDPATGALDQTFTQASGAGGALEYIQSLLFTGNSLYAGGYVNSYRGGAAQGLLKLNPVTGALDTTFSKPTGFGNAQALLSSGSSILVAGSFQSYRGIPSFNLAKVDASSGNPDPTFTTSSPCDSCGVNFDALTLVGTKLYVGGDDPTLYRGTPTYGVFPVDLSTGNPTDP